MIRVPVLSGPIFLPDLGSSFSSQFRSRSSWTKDSGVALKRVLVLEAKDTWASFLKECLVDFAVEFQPESRIAGALGMFDRVKPALVFCETGFLTLPLLQKLKVRKETDPLFRVYLLGEPGPSSKNIRFDGAFPLLSQAPEFLRRFSETLPMPEMVRLLVVDDEEEIPDMVRDYFEERKAPVFRVFRARNGLEGLATFEKEKPDLIILDIKMPEMDGREFYAELCRRKVEVPVIVFFDSISGDELEGIRKHGNPSVVEKGTLASSLPALMALVKTMLFFGL